MQVFFFEAFAEEDVALRHFCRGRFAADYSWCSIQEWGSSQRPPAPIISIRTQSAIPAAWAAHLQGILSRSTGYDHLLHYQKAHKPCPALAYLPLYCHRAVAEQAFCLCMALLRKLPKQIRQFKQFQRDNLSGMEIQGKNLLVLGVGNIGSEIVNIGRGLGMQVRGVDPLQKCPGLEYGSFEENAAWADIVMLAMNLNEANQAYFNQEKINMLKPGAMLINVARGEFTPLDVMAEAINNGQLGALGLDVYEDETSLGPALRSETTLSLNTHLQALMKSEQVIMTPHNAFNTIEAVQRKAEQSVQQIEAFLKNGRFIWQLP